MPPRSTDEIRQAYLDFFGKRHGHAVIGGASLIPENDPTVLFTTAGMHPLVPYLLGEKHPAGKRLVDVQRCIRTQDIDEVGDASHLTFFEMLGNWSLGDYFKEGAIKMSYEFLTQVLELDPKMLAVSCFEGDQDAPKDEESARVWKLLGVPEERIAFLPKAKNWWGPAGKTGPCGPDTEMFYWIGAGEPRGNPKTHEREWLEIWNDVFMEYEKKEDGSFVPLKQKNVDTGMGLERVAQVMQGVASVYETDRMKPILDKVVLFSSSEPALTVLGTGSRRIEKQPLDSLRSLEENNVRHARIIVDHLKAATFMIADGVQPSNIDRGYVLRKLIRRSVRSGRVLGFGDSPFTAEIANVVAEQYGHVYSHLQQKLPVIRETLLREEQQFRKTLQEGLKLFEIVMKEFPQGSRIAGKSVFHLYDTYGFPMELTREIAQERGFVFDKATEYDFKKAFEEHQKLSRAGAEKRFAGGLADHSAETTKLHTATHLLNAALRKVLGDHVWQKGSNVTAERLRFDFSHPTKMTPEEIQKVESLVNEAIKRDLPVSYSLMTVEEAKKANAIGVFEEKYASMGLSTGGDRVKVYKMGNFSLEICGGPHVAQTGLLGSFKIQKEEAVSAGVRRIKAVIAGGPKEIQIAQESV